MQIAVRRVLVRIRQLIFAEVDNRRQRSQFGPAEAEEFREVEHVGTENGIPRSTGTQLRRRFVGKRHSRVTHSPLPLVGRQRQQVESMPTVRNPTIEKCTVASAVIRIKRENVHVDLLSCPLSLEG